ncbi:dipeptide/oligopeptide/nickel ABC transporter permease/ATP-binding protein [Pilimelia columellifera]|uniref:Dipeptide/oligopeptide/nickel ABC transporter permease/ATP-binding protein n=1 Tax=Pilimelia columellifera subsp. columellifera TaxID=706583 RepID=A0ABN3NQE7_9ACTN
MTGLLRHRGGRAGTALALALVAFAVFGPALATADPDLPDYANQLAAPGAAHWLGTDDAGRDLLARTIAGARTSLQAVLVVFALTTTLGLLVGGAAGYLGGIVDAVISRVIDVMLGLPSQIIALAIVGALGVGADNLILAIVAAGWAYPARIARSATLGSHTRLDVIAARMAGIGPARVLRTHILPGALATVVVAATATVGETVLVLAGLSFLGLGAQPPTAELGQMLADSQGSLVSSPWLLIGPTVIIALTVTAAMLLSDALRDVLDPQPTEVRARTAPPVAVRAPATVTDAVALRVTDLAVTYSDGARAVRGVSLTLRSGQCLAVVGESGCGKTTLARAVLRLLPPAATITGHVQVDDQDILNLDAPAMRRARGRAIGYVAQDPYAACDPLHPVRHHVTEAWLAHRRRPDRSTVTGRVADLGVQHARERLAERPHRWSGGMLQRATIAAATVHQPALTVADEPTSALDADLSDDVLITLRQASQAVLLISHDLRLVARHSDHIAVMYAGRIVETGTTGDILDNPRHPYTRALLAATPPVEGPPARSLPGAPPSLAHHIDPGCAFAPRCVEARSICHDREPVLVGGVACFNGDQR